MGGRWSGAGPPEDLQVGSSTIADVTPIEVTLDAPHWTVSFRSCIAYAVRDASFAVPAPSEHFSGRSLRLYQVQDGDESATPRNSNLPSDTEACTGPRSPIMHLDRKRKKDK